MQLMSVSVFGYKNEIIFFVSLFIMVSMILIEKLQIKGLLESRTIWSPQFIKYEYSVSLKAELLARVVAT